MLVGRVVAAPEMVQDLIARQDPPGIGRQQIEQAQLQRCQVHVLAVDPHPAVQDVDLQLTEANHWLNIAVSSRDRAPVATVVVTSHPAHGHHGLANA